MVDMQRKEVIDKISDDLKIQPSMQIPRALMDKIQLSYNVNPRRQIRFPGTGAIDATSATILTTSLVKDTFLIGAYITVTKDVVSNSVNSSVQCTAQGDQNRSVLVVRYEPTTAGEFQQSIIFPIPIKLARGTTITVVNGSATASIDTTGIVYIFETDPE